MPDKSFPTGNPARAMLDAMGEGSSASQALRDFRAAGGRMQDARWYRLWGEVTAGRANAGDIAAQPFNAPFDAADHTRWTTAGPERFGYQTKVYVNRSITLPDGTRSQFIDQEPMMVTSATPLSPAEIAAQAVDQARNGLQLDQYNGSVLDAAVTGAFRMGGG